MSAVFRAALFQSTPSVGRATDKAELINKINKRFQSTPSVGRATTTARRRAFRASFQSTPSVGRATKLINCIKIDSRISIHALRGEGDIVQGYRFPNIIISIHALRGEGDVFSYIDSYFVKHFNPRPPWGGRRSRTQNIIVKLAYFNPRPPWGGRPSKRIKLFSMEKYFNPRPPWGGRPLLDEITLDADSFQSTPSVGRATAKIYKYAMLCLYIVHIKLYIFATAVLFT